MNRLQKILILFSIVFTVVCTGQKDSLKVRKTGVGISHATISIGSIFMLNELWYKDYPKSKFHFYNDWDNWLQMDKVGHAYTAYALNHVLYKNWIWAGCKHKQAAILAFGTSFAYQTGIEFLDAHSAEWGFSWGDFGANLFGSALYSGQEFAFGKQYFYLRFSYFPSKYAALRPNVLGATFSERLLKDYNAQSYYLSFSPNDFGWKRFPEFIDICIAYSADSKLYGKENYAFINGNEYLAKRQLGLSVDVRWDKLPIKNKRLKAILGNFNVIKIPVPSIYFESKALKIGFL